MRGGARPFDYAALKGEARALAGKPFEPPAKLAPSALQELSYDQYQSIRFRREHALWGQEDGHFRLEFFHMGRGFKEPVRMYEIVDGQAREILYRPELFDLSRSGIQQRSLGKDLIRTSRLSSARVISEAWAAIPGSLDCPPADWPSTRRCPSRKSFRASRRITSSGRRPRRAR
jgi:hypothetical protein